MLAGTGSECVIIIIMINFPLPLSEGRRERNGSFEQWTICYLTIAFSLLSCAHSFLQPQWHLQCEACTLSFGMPSAELFSQILHWSFLGEEPNLSEHSHGCFVWTFLFLHSLLPSWVPPHKALERVFPWKYLWRSLETHELLTINSLC